MPLYEYRCKACGHRFEKIQTFSAPDEKECPVCKGEVERLISAPAVQFKGSGFYSTDYGTKPSAPKSAEGAKTDGAGAGGSDGGKAAAASSETAKPTASGPAPSTSAGSSGKTD